MRAALLLLTLAPGCLATPIPDPPSADTLFVSPTSTGPLRIDGMSESVDPGVTIVAVNLDATGPFVRATASADGGFSLLVPGSPFNVVRLHVEENGAHSEPLDIVATGGTPTAVIPPLAACLSMPGVVELGDVAVGSTRTIAIPIQNDCADVAIDAIALRAPRAGLAVVTSAPLNVPAASSATIEIDVAPTAPGTLEEVVLVNVAAPETGRRAVTLFGTAR